jgi:four helix bundle protein
MSGAGTTVMGIAEDLRQRTFRFALRVIRFCRVLPDSWDAREVGRQLLRAGMGVAGNYWSACRGRSHREFTSKLGVATDEASEAELWLMVIIQSEMSKGQEAVELLSESRELLAILSKSYRTARERGKRVKRSITNSPIPSFTKSI